MNIRSASSWSMFIAAIALILSQLPPVTHWMPEKKLKGAIATRLALSSTLGFINYGINLQIFNEGNRKVKITNLDLELIDPSGHKKKYSGESYNDFYYQNGIPVAYPIDFITIDPNNSWSNQVNFVLPLTEEQDKFVNEVKLQVINDLTNKRQKTTIMTINVMCEADKNIVDKACNYFTNNLSDQLSIGKYEAIVIAKDASGSILFKTPFKFHLYDHHKKIIESQKDDLKYGIGILYPANSLKMASIRTEQ